MASGMGIGNIGSNVGMNNTFPIPKDPLTFEILLHDKKHKAGSVSFEGLIYDLNSNKVSAAAVNREKGKHIDIYV
jgi:hypothetical protein